MFLAKLFRLNGWLGQKNDYADNKAMSLDNNTVLKSSTITASKNHLSSEIDGETVLLDIESGVYLGLNSVGSSIWNLIAESKKVTDIRDAIANEYEIDLDSCEKDVLDFLEKLADEGLIEVQNAMVA